MERCCVCGVLAQVYRFVLHMRFIDSDIMTLAWLPLGAVLSLYAL